MSKTSIPRTTRHSGATGKTPLPTLLVGTRTDMGIVAHVRTKKKYPKRYLIDMNPGGYLVYKAWMRRDQFTVIGDAS